MKLKRSLCLFLTALAGCAITASAAENRGEAKATSVRPNILWIIAEDIGLDLGCYGNRDARTPRLDRLASQSRLYRRAYCTGPVCSPSRSAFMTGMYQTSFGAHHHRSHRDDGHRLPAGVRLLTDRLREAGYFTANVVEFPAAMKLRGAGKTDWNFQPPDKPFDSSKWEALKGHQPFYAQVNLNETHRIYHKAGANPTDPAKVALPPYLPDHPVAREDWALYHDSMMALDAKVGAVLDLLEQEGLGGNTIVFFFGDNGRECFRGKYFAYEQGCQVPLMVRWPKLLPAGSTSDELVSLIDVTATTLALAGVPVPEGMHGQPFLGPNARRRGHLFTAMDRVGTKVDRVRTVRDARYKYIRNFEPARPYLPPSMPYADETNPNFNLMRQLSTEGKLNAAQAKFMAPSRPAEELYDLQTDPFELNNLAGLPEHKQALTKLRSALEQWMVDTNDQGRTPEDPVAQKREIEKLTRQMEKQFGTRAAGKERGKP
ncbi:MAG: sulfatase [Verrucomicrobia bacterium]|nr:sulfatase [Verrucomicrobiota bacterium]